MLERGDYVVPYFNNVYRFDKPPLVYWLQTVSYRLFGDNDFAARFPSAIATSLTALLLFAWGRRIGPERMAWWAAIIFSLCLQTYIHARAAVADMWLVFFVTAAHWAGFELLRDRLQPQTAAADARAPAKVVVDLLSFPRFRLSRQRPDRLDTASRGGREQALPARTETQSPLPLFHRKRAHAFGCCPLGNSRAHAHKWRVPPHRHWAARGLALLRCHGGARPGLGLGLPRDAPVLFRNNFPYLFPMGFQSALVDAQALGESRSARSVISSPAQPSSSLSSPS